MTRTLFSSRRLIPSVVLIAVVAGALLLRSPRVSSEPRRAAKVTQLMGKATSSAGGTGPKVALVKDGLVFENDLIETASGTKVELRTDDGSAVRVGPSSKLQLKSAYFGAGGDKKFSGKLFFGKVWTNVTGLVGGGSKFEVETDNAVAGVRGTTFMVEAGQDKSVQLKVYDGSVAMTSAALARKREGESGGRRQVAGPRRVSVEEWEKLVGKMMMLSVNADGTSGEPVPFKSDADAGDDWAAWNREQDAAMENR